MNKAVALVFAGLFLPQFAQAEKLPIKIYTASDGLAHNHINRIKLDSHGFLWFCTDAGLSRFDGRQFFTLTTDDGLPHPDVNDIVEARDGVFWLATDGGISKFTLNSPGSTEKPKIVTIRSAEHPADRYDAVEFDLQGRLWAGGHEGLYQMEATREGDRLKWAGEPLPNAFIPRLLADRAGGLWIATSLGPVFRTSDGKFVPIKSSPLGEDVFTESLLQDRSGHVWIGYRTGGLCRLRSGPEPGGAEIDYCLGQQHGLARDIRSIHETDDGQLWVATSVGLFQTDPGSREITHYGPAHGLSERRVLRIAEDPEGNLWLGTAQSGVMKLSRPGFVQFTPADGHAPSWNPMLLSTRNGQLILATVDDSGNSRFLEFRGRGFHEFWNAVPEAHRSERHEPLALEDSHGQVWLASGRFLYRFPSSNVLNRLRYAQPSRFALPPGDMYRRAHQSQNGDLWTALVTSGRDRSPKPGMVLVRNPVRAQAYTVPAIESSLKRVAAAIGMNVWVTSFQEDSAGALWLGVGSLRLVYRENTVTLLRYHQDKIREFSMADGLPPGSVNSLYADRKGRLWIATHAGLALMDNPTSERPRFFKYALKSGLSSDEVWCVAEDAAGRIYAGTAKGVDRIDMDTSRIRHFTIDEGLPRGRVQEALADSRGRLWFASDNGVSRFEPERAPTQPPMTYLVRPSGVYKLSHDRNHFEAEFSSPSFSGLSPRFQYRLARVDPDWSAPVADGVVRYAGMSPGSYELQARAVNAEGVVSPQPVSVRFTVMPPFWRTWWFLALATCIVAAVAYWLHHRRVEHLLAVERLRIRIASDLHDDIGSTLSQVSLLGELANRSLNGANPGVSDLIERMAGASRDAVSSMSDIVWSIHPRSDNMKDLSLRMRRFAVDILSARGIDFDIKIPEEDLSLGPEARRDLLLMFKEGVNNAARHSRCRIVRAGVEIDGRNLRMTIDDDGEGFDIAADSPGQGLGTMRARAEKLGGRCEVLSTVGRGTRVEVMIPAAGKASLI
jgi:ligand-binding sensor domain-containing protein/two-component sensor histidine kinase